MTRIKTKAILGLVWAALGALPLLAGNGIDISGAHYNLNIIGVENGTNLPTLSGTDRHTIFVPLTNSGGTHSTIYLTPGPFQVCDGNAFDSVHDCAGVEVKTTAGAMFQLPCNTAIPADITCGGGVYTAAYEVWARALGQPGNSATITTCEVDPATGNTVVCSTENVMLVRSKGQPGNPPKFTDFTNELTSLVVSGQRVALFSNNLVDFVWQYQNNGLRLAQLRFYLLN
jgi:hypothetical protein